MKIFVTRKIPKQGLDLLKKRLISKVGFDTEAAGNFIARRRHLEALKTAKNLLLHGEQQVHNFELLAEDLHQAQNALGEITGKFYPEDLLDRIFAEFCIGK